MVLTMTEEEILQLEPAPCGKLDVLLAEKLGIEVDAGLWRPSTDLNCAMMVLMEVAGKKHWHWEIISQDGYDSGPLVYVTIWHGKKSWEAGSRYGDMKDSVSLAICRAVLLVLFAVVESK